MVQEQINKFRREKNREPTDEELQSIRSNIADLIRASREQDDADEDGEEEEDEEAAEKYA